MTGILDQIRRTTPESLEGVRTDFDDLAASVYRPRVPREMIRDVPGATDLRDAMPPRMPNMNAGLVGPGTVDTRPYQDEVGMPSDRQRAFIDSLMGDLKALDLGLWNEGMAYICRMSENKAWDRSRGGNVSRWIDTLKTKIAALRSAGVDRGTPDYAGQPSYVPASGNVQHDALPTRNNKSGKPMPQHYAVEIDGVLKFYQIKPGSKPGWWWVDAQASDTLFPVRNVATKNEILRAIVAAGAEACRARYGQEIGECGRCGRTLTDELSRSRGIGPDCWEK